MTTKLLCLLCLFSLFVLPKANATIWRVNNNGYAAHFTELQQANDANNVSDGDTIHLEGSTKMYESAVISKRLIIIGSGYFLEQNVNTSSDQQSTRIKFITFDPGSEGSQLIAVHQADYSMGIDIKTGHITIRRCLIDYDIRLFYNISDIKIIENFFPDTKTTASIFTFYSIGFVTDLIVNNNIIQRTLILPANSEYMVKECKNNIFNVPTESPAIQLYAGTFENNILNNPNATVSLNGGNFTNVDYNISASSKNQFGADKHNLVVSDTARLFAGGLSHDARYMSKAGSPAIGSGSDGTDRGVFGGGASQNWYTLSGLAPIPVIYNISSGGVGTSGLPVTIKARTIK